MNKLPVRISSKIIQHESGCWIWDKALDRHGYGVVRWEGKACRAHRVVYFLIKQKTKLPLDHLCRVPACVNPEHLEPVTNRENTIRGIGPTAARERYARHVKCPLGHSLEGDNLYTHLTKKGYINKQCRTCRRDSKRKRRAAGAKG